MKNKTPFYYYDEKNLTFKKVSLKTVILFFFISFLISASMVPLFFKSESVQVFYADFYEPETIVVNVVEEKNEFSEEKLINMIKDLNLKFPHIILAQAKLETGNFTSNIFKENHNLFGMKEAKLRVNIARGTQYNHAFYNHWTESVYDYAFYQSTYLSKLKTEEQYFTYLGESYAEADRYVETLKGMIERENLKELFEN